MGQNWLVLGDVRSLWGSTGWYLPSLGGTGSVQVGTGRYLAILGQKKAALVGTWWHTSYLSFFLHSQFFWRMKFTPNNAIFFALNL